MTSSNAPASDRSARLPAMLRALRVHQWTKNILIFVAPVLAHRLADRTVLVPSVLAFAAFCLVASGGYVFNDLLDREADRRDPAKRGRPWAEGSLPAAAGWVLAILMAAAGFALAAAALPVRFVELLALYLALSGMYSLWLKRRVMLDTILLAGLYSLRVLGGAEAAAVKISPWLLAFSTFFFLSLAFMKRYGELQSLGPAGEEYDTRRGYRPADASMLRAMGPASGYLSVLVLAFYMSSPEVPGLYRKPEVLWLICPLVLYWISRLWLLAHRGRMHADPIVFALTDPASYVVGALTTVVMAWAMSSCPFPG